MGTVYLVGAGPGDPGLLTLRAAELLEQADVVVHDALASDAVLQRCRAGAGRIRVDPVAGEPSSGQGEVDALLVELARSHRRVVRLAGGDPFLFGRGGEEALALRAAGVPFEVVPGVAAGVAAAAYAGIPVTHRDLASSVALFAGEAPAGGADTLVLHTAVQRLRDKLRRLVEAGRAAETPAAAIERGTHPRQRTVAGTLSTLAAEVEARGLEAPLLVVVGDVVGLRERLGWFESRPLSGRAVVVTRARAQAGGFAAQLRELGAEVVHFPTIRITDPTDPEPLRAAVRAVDGFDWILFTSVNGVARFWEELRASGADTRLLGGVSICAIGPATAAAVELEGASADVVPDEFVGEAVVEALTAEAELEGARILIPRAEVARSVVPDGLRARGAEVVEVAAYRTVPDGAGADRLRERLAEGSIDLVTFTASSTVRNYVELIGAELGGAGVASIGPITSATAREFGLPVDAEAEEYTVPGLVRAIRRHFEEGG